MRSCSTGAIVLRTRPLREADLLLTCLTPELGKLVGVAAHARRSQRRFGGALEMGTIGVLQYTEQAHRDLVRVEEVRVEWTPLGAPSPLAHFAALGVMLDIAEATTVERQSGVEKFQLLRAAILHLHEAPQQMLLQWCIRWFAVLGVAPILDRCLRCRTPCDAAAVVTFLPAEGGILCPQCGRGGGMAIALDPVSCLRWRQLAAGEHSHWAPARPHARPHSGAEGGSTGQTGSGGAGKTGDASQTVPVEGASLLRRSSSGCEGRTRALVIVRTLPDAVWQYCCHVTGRTLTSGRYWEMVWNDSV